MKYFVLTLLFFILICPVFSDEPSVFPDFNALTDNRRYRDAVALFELGSTDRAFKLFHEYLEIFPRGAHRHGAYRHIADIYRDRFDYTAAADIYLKIYAEFSPEERAVAAYYEAALCYSKMGYDKKAALIYSEIIEKWPDSPHASRSRTQLKVISIIEEGAGAD